MQKLINWIDERFPLIETFEYLDIKFDVPVSDRIFSFRELERGRNR